MVTSYDNSQCRYRLSNLDRVVYLLPESGDIHIDAGAAYVNYVPQMGEAYQLRVRSVSLTDTTEHSGRYNFKQALTFSLGGLVTDIPVSGRYYAIIKSTDGTYWLVNPYHPLTPTYVFTLDQTGPRTDYTLQDREAMPVLEIRDFTPLHSRQCDVYAIDGVDRLFLNEVKYSAYRPNGDIRYTNNGFKEIVAMKNTVSLEQRYDGHNFYTTVRLSIPWDDFKTDWHYRLLEYKDNRYAAVLLSRAGNFYMAGFDDGLFPSYQVQADSIQGQTDRVEVTLVNARCHGPIQYARAAEISQFTEKAFIPTSEHDGYICVSPGVAQYILKKEVDAFGNETGRYQAFDGYKDRFPDLNVIETPFTEVITFPSAQCSPDGSQLKTTLTDVIYFHNRGSKEYTIYCNACSWTANTITGWLNIGPTTGAAKTNTVFTITNMLEPTESPASGQVTARCCEYTKVVTVIVVKGDDCFPPYTIDGAAQTITANTNCCVAAVGQAPAGTEVVSIGSDNVVIKVDQNESGSDRQFLIPVTYCDNTTGTITVNQSFNYSEWVEDGTICDDETKNLYVREVEYTGLTPTTVNRLSGRVRQGRLLMEDSLECKEKQYKWVETDMMVCEAGLMYPLLVQLESVEGGPWVETGNQKTGDTPVDDPEGICEAKETIVDWLTIEGYICDGFAKYEKQQLRKSSDGGTTWTVEEVYRKGDKIADESTDCGYDPALFEHDCYEWFDFGNTRCDGFGLYHEEEFVWADEPCPADRTQWHRTDVKKFGYLINYPSETCGYDPVQTGSTWVDWVVVDNEWFCDDGVKYTLEEKFISEDAGATWDPTGITRKGADVIEYESTDCGYIDGWCSSQLRDEGDTICDGVNKMHYLRRWVTFDCSVEHPVYEPTDMYVVSGVHTYNSTDCGYVPGGSDELDEWRSAEGTICDGTTKYSREEKYHSIDGGQYWVATGVYRKGPEIERNSTDCGYDPGISDYAYEQWRDEQDYICEDVNKMHYVRKYVSDVSADGPWEATNIYRMSGVAEYNSTDCGYVPDSQDTGYTVQWVILPDQFICEEYSKYHKEMKQVSHDNGAHWVNTEVYRRGNLIETNSEYCGYRPTTEEKWENEGYMCEGYSKYNRQRKYTRPVGGTEWTATDQYRRGSFIEGNSEYCGYEPPAVQYKWEQDPTEFICNGTTKYHKDYQWSSTTGDEGSWAKTGVSRQGTLWETDSTSCGYVPPQPEIQYKWEEDPTEYICNGTIKYHKEYQWSSATGDDGSWTKTGVSRQGSLWERDSTDCGYTPQPKYRWIEDETGYTCNDTTKYHLEYQWSSMTGDEGSWIKTSVSRRGSWWEYNSADCGYTPPGPDEYPYSEWRKTDGYRCNSTTKYSEERRYVSNDNTNWIPTDEYRTGSEVLEYNSLDCGAVQPDTEYRWILTDRTACFYDDSECEKQYRLVPDEYVCDDYNLVTKLEVWKKCPDDSDWVDTGSWTFGDTIIEENSTICADRKGDVKAILTLNNGRLIYINTPQLDHLYSSEVAPYADSVVSAKVFSCVRYLAPNVFSGCTHLTNVELNEGLEMIGQRAFFECSGLTSIELPSTLMSLGAGAFKECSSLQNVDMSRTFLEGYIDAYTFEDCDSLTSIVLPDGVNMVNLGAFDRCDSLRTVELPGSVNEIYGDFHYCPNLESVTLKSITPPSGRIEQAPVIYVPTCAVETYKTDDNWKFVANLIQGLDSCPSAGSVKCTLRYKNGSTSVVECNLSSVLQQYEVGADWNDRQNIVSASVGGSVKTIGNAFGNCGSLSSITIPSNVTRIGWNAFNGCSGLTSVTIPPFVRNIDYGAFGGTPITSITIPNSVTWLGHSAFSQCRNLMSVTLSQNINTIEEYTFNMCSSLSSVTIPNSVTKIWDGAFSDCLGLKNVTVGSSVYYIGDLAFYNCRNMVSFTITTPEPPKLGLQTFYLGSQTFYVPAESIDKYRTAEGWNEFYERIRPIS